jgi:glycosyltransferase involved in cell wall biosynthesis
VLGANLGWDGVAKLGRQAAEARRMIEAEAPDICLLPLPWPDAGLGIMQALAEARLPRLAILHLVPEGALPQGLDPAAVAAGAPRDMAWAAVSAPAARRAEALFGLDPAQIRVVPNAAPPGPPPGTDRAGLRLRVRAGLGVQEGEGLVVFVGRLERGKGADLLPELARRLDATLAVAGDGSLQPALAQAAASDPRARLRLLGSVADPSPLYLAADALVLPSRMEGAPLVFMEAAAHRTPVIATAAALEALGEDAPRMALLVPESDAAALAAALPALRADPAGTRSRVEEAEALARRLTWDRATEAWAGLLRAAALRAT